MLIFFFFAYLFTYTLYISCYLYVCGCTLFFNFVIHFLWGLFLYHATKYREQYWSQNTALFYVFNGKEMSRVVFNSTFWLSTQVCWKNWSGAHLHSDHTTIPGHDNTASKTMPIVPCFILTPHCPLEGWSATSLAITLSGVQTDRVLVLVEPENSEKWETRFILDR